MNRRVVLTAMACSASLAAAACAGAGGGGGGGAGTGGDGTTDTSKPIRVLMVGNPQMTDIAKITPTTFTTDTGIKVSFTILPENELRDKVTQDVATQGGQYDVVTIGAYETPIWSKNDWLHELSSYAEKDTAYDVDDLLDPMVTSLSGEDGKLYAAPFYGESSFLMYRKDLFDKAGLTMPKKPTWQQVEQFAAKLHDKASGMTGICLRGLPGWGEVFAPLTTVVNTFGGTWFDQDYTPKVNAPEFTQATQFYVDLVKKYGEPGATQSGFTECANLFAQGKAAMWYDATSATNTVEDTKTSKVAGKVGYALAPVVKTEYSGWLWAWAWAMPKTTKQADNAWKFISWATSKDYEQLVGKELGWARVPSGKRESTYEIPEYKKISAAYADLTLESIENADPKNPGVQPRPALGVQFVAIPEFADLGTKVSQEVAAAMVGRQTVQQALAKGQQFAEQVVKDGDYQQK